MSLSHLESRKTMLDFKHAKEELILKKEIISEIDGFFNNAVNDFLKTNDILNKKWKQRFNIDDSDDSINLSDDQTLIKSSKIDSKIDDENIETGEIISDIEIEDIISESEKIDPFASTYKMVYREIVKKTHPDKISHLSEEEISERGKIYLDATKAYEEKNIGDLLYCAYLVKVSFGIGDNEIKLLKNIVVEYKKESDFLEQTYSWKWFYADDLTKMMLVEKFIIQLTE